MLDVSQSDESLPPKNTGLQRNTLEGFLSILGTVGGTGESTTETQSEFLLIAGIRTGRRDGRRGDRSPNLAAERKQRYPYAARRIEY